MARVSGTVENRVDACPQGCLALWQELNLQEYHYPRPAYEGLRQLG